MRSQQGFTLIELIVSLVLLGIIGSLAGFGLARGMEAYVFSRNNSEMMHRAQFALNRIRLELIHMDDVTSASPTSITYTNVNRDPSDSYTITRAGNQVTLTVNAGAGQQTSYLLMDQVGTYAPGENIFAYDDNDGSTWSSGTDDFKTLRTIEVRIVMSRPDMTREFNFETRVNPRGNGARNAPKPIRHDQ